INRLLAPIMPHACQRLHHLLGYDDTLAPQPTIETEQDPDGKPRPVLTGDYQQPNQWHVSTLKPGAALRDPAPLFRKLDDTLVAEELARLGNK
ncbi:MAG: hypothetical protein RLZZ297_917, partial [Chloroflexota bacterium]